MADDKRQLIPSGTANEKSTKAISAGSFILIAGHKLAMEVYEELDLYKEEVVNKESELLDE